MQDDEKLGWVRMKVKNALRELQEAEMWAFHLNLEVRHRDTLNEAVEKTKEACLALYEARRLLDSQGE